jgi:UDP-N-acetylglucosamine--N-acetylmuramyl-(pentapeptide) pyrophosphoryl-undecaprenol N-acetylglucosamine transferase
VIDAQVTEFIDDMAEAYAWADLVVCRAGAMTVAELAGAGLGAVLVPYAHAVSDHQAVNAAFLTDAGAAVMLREDELDDARLAEVLREIGDRARLLDMACRARSLGRPAATEQVAQACMEMMRA